MLKLVRYFNDREMFGLALALVANGVTNTPFSRFGAVLLSKMHKFMISLVNSGSTSLVLLN